VLLGVARVIMVVALISTLVAVSASSVYAAPAPAAQPATADQDAAAATQERPAGAGSEAGAAAGSGTGAAGQNAGQNAGVSVSLNGTGSEGSSTALQLLILFTLLAVAPSVLIMMTGFTRILIVLGFIRNALGTPTMPPNQVLVGLALFLTVFVMFPTFSTINKVAVQPFQNQEITQQQAIKRAQVPIRKFMFAQVDDKDLALFVRLSEIDTPKTKADIPTYVVIPAFLISELKIAFQIGFLIFIPFLIIDMVVASTLMSMGMIMLPPVMISLPFKILLFVLVDGWHLTVESLVLGFGTG
jgi:flagellar biosynthetic protein FliP